MRSVDHGPTGGRTFQSLWVCLLSVSESLWLSHAPPSYQKVGIQPLRFTQTAEKVQQHECFGTVRSQVHIGTRLAGGVIKQLGSIPIYPRAPPPACLPMFDRRRFLPQHTQKTVKSVDTVDKSRRGVLVTLKKKNESTCYKTQHQANSTRKRFTLSKDR